jgi:hypothetical protein
MKMTAFWNITPCSLVEVEGRFRVSYCVHHQGDITHFPTCSTDSYISTRYFARGSFIALKTGEVCTSETSVYFTYTAFLYYPEGNLPNRENLKFQIDL